MSSCAICGLQDQKWGMSAKLWYLGFTDSFRSHLQIEQWRICLMSFTYFIEYVRSIFNEAWYGLDTCRASLDCKSPTWGRSFCLVIWEEEEETRILLKHASQGTFQPPCHVETLFKDRCQEQDAPNPSDPCRYLEEAVLSLHCIPKLIHAVHSNPRLASKIVSQFKIKMQHQSNPIDILAFSRHNWTKLGLGATHRHDKGRLPHDCFWTVLEP